MRLLNRCEASSIIPGIINIAVPHAQSCAAGISGSAGARRVRPVVGWGARQRELHLVSSDFSGCLPATLSCTSVLFEPEGSDHSEPESSDQFNKGRAAMAVSAMRPI